MGIVQHTVTDDLSGERADKVVAVLAGVSRSVARSMVEEGLATFDGEVVDPSDRVTAGTAVTTDVPAPTELAPEDIPLEVLYEDGDLAVVNKAAGMVVHPGAGNATGTLAAAALWRWPELRGVGVSERWGIVHRLDRDTSGALLVAKTAAAYDRLTGLLERREIGRRYLALAEGEFAIPTGTIDAPVGRDRDDPTRFTVTPSGRQAVTHYTLEQQFPEAGLLEVTLETGRTHQIRVHLASIGHPVVGDRLYGKGGGPAVPRIFLPAASVAVPGDSGLTVEAPLPEDLAAVLASLSEQE